MPKMRALWLRLRGLFGALAESDFEDELESHVAMDIDEGVRSGLSLEEARRQALIRLGGAEQTRQAYRDRSVLPLLDSLGRDVRLSIRTLRRHPGVTVAAVISIALGIGANATIFSMVSRFVLRPAPVGDPTTLLALHTTRKDERCCNSFSWPLFEDLQAQAKSFSGVAAYFDLLPASIGGNGEPERIWGQGVTTNYFDVAELRMTAGSGFATGADRAPVVVLGESLWRRRFGADPGIVGRAVQLSGHTFTVVGVAPAGFHGIDQLLIPQFWVPLGDIKELAASAPSRSARAVNWLDVVARLKPGVTRSDASAELATIAGRVATSHPNTDEGLRFVFEEAGTLPPRERGTVELFLAALMLVVLLVLAIAGANVANLMFAQAAARQKEMAVRLALGSTRARLRRRLLTESVLMALAGGVLGVGLSVFATRGLSAFHVPAPVPLDLAPSMDGRTLFYSFLLSVVCGVLLGAAPAWAASRPRLVQALKGEDALARPGRRLRLRNLLVVAQIAMAVVLLSATGLFLRSLESAARIHIGFRTQGLLMLSVDPRLNGYTPERTVEFLKELRERAAALPGVDAAVCTDVPLLSGGNRSDGMSASGAADARKVDSVDLYMVTPGFFRALGIPMLAGHDFPIGTAADAPRIAVVNRDFAERMFPGENPIGQHITDAGKTFEIVGVVGNSKSRTLGEAQRPVLYRSLAQSIAQDPSMMGYTLIVHTAGDPKTLARPLRQLVTALDPAMASYHEETMEEHVRAAFFLPRLAATLFGVFGGIGLVLAAVGVYGVMSYAVSLRTREIGIRMAMGAERTTVERQILRQGMVLAAIALALGWPTAWLLAKMASSFLYGVAPHDPVTFLAVPLVLVLLALGSCWLPARRAAAVDPMVALRAE